MSIMKASLLKIITLVLLVCNSHLLVGLAPKSQTTWPRIAPFSHTFEFSSNMQMFLHFAIDGIDGKEEYFVECASPFADDARVREYAYSRDFECRVATPNATLMPDIQLLALNSRVDKEWQSRGGFWWSELVPECFSYPDWGSKRTYRFRDMALTINISDVKMEKVLKPSEHEPYFRLQSLKVVISGKPDVSARDAFGGFSRFPEPAPSDPQRPYGYLNCSTTARPK